MSKEVTGQVGEHELHVEFVDEKDAARKRSNAAKAALKRGFWWLAKLLGGSIIGGSFGWWVLASIADWPHPVMGGLPCAIMGIALAFAGRDLRPREGDWSVKIDWTLVLGTLIAICIGMLVMLLLVGVGVHPIAATMWGAPIMVIALIVTGVRDLDGEWMKLHELFVFIPDGGLLRKVPLGICWGTIISGLLGLLLSSLWLEAGAVAGLVAFRAAMPKMLPTLSSRRGGLVSTNFLIFVATLVVVMEHMSVVTVTTLIAGIVIGAIVGLTKAKS